jgi:hypothetical protein
MSSEEWNQLTCQNLASSMSCLAMRDLAMKESQENRDHLSYMLLDPSLKRLEAKASCWEKYNLMKCKNDGKPPVDVPKTGVPSWIGRWPQ